MTGTRVAAWCGIAGAVLYVLAGYLSFEMPQSLADAELCGFVADDFDAAGQLSYPPVHAWWVSFVRKQEYFGALTVGVALAFVGYALWVGRRAGRGARAGAVAGGGVLAFSALCVGCLAPVMSAVGLGLFSTWLADVPSWLIALNTVLICGWGALMLSRRLTRCELPARAAAPCARET